MKDPEEDQDQGQGLGHETDLVTRTMSIRDGVIGRTLSRGGRITGTLTVRVEMQETVSQ